MANPVVPGLALTLGVLLALARHLETNDRAWLALAVALALAVPAFKVFLGAHLLLGLGAAGLRASSRGRVAIVAVALAAALMTGALALGAGGDTVTVTWAPLDLARVTRASLGLAPVGGLRLGAWAAIWLAASLGLRLLGLGRAWAALRGDNPLATALASMALASWPIGLLIRIGAPAMLPGQRPINDVAFLLEQGGALLWVFAAPLVAALAGRFGRARVLGLSALLCLPSTAQYAIQKNLWPNDAIPAPMVRACRDLERASRPGDVILQRPGGRFPPAPVLLIGRRVPYERFTPWLTQFGTPEALEGRHELVYGFFRTHERAEALAIAQRLEARFACVYGGEHLRFDTTGLESVHDEAAARCYRLVP